MNSPLVVSPPSSPQQDVKAVILSRLKIKPSTGEERFEIFSAWPGNINLPDLIAKFLLKELAIGGIHDHVSIDGHDQDVIAKSHKPEFAAKIR